MTDQIIVEEVRRTRIGSDAIAICNALGSYANGPLMPMRAEKVGGVLRFLDLGGLRIVEPDHWREATREEIVIEMDRQGVTPFCVDTITKRVQ